MSIILPFRDTPGECLSTGPSQEASLLWKKRWLSTMHYNFNHTVTLLKDLDLAALITCLLKDLIRCKRCGRLRACEDRHRWALDLLDATSWLEKLGFIHGDLAVRNLGVDSVNTLKIFDFGSSSRSESSTDVITDHFDLATCLHFILSGVDPFAGVQSRSEAIQIRDTLQAGRWTIAQGAEVIGDVIQDGWTGRAGAKSFKDLLNQVTRILGVPSVPLDLKARREYYQRLQLRCQDWLCNTPKNPLWKKPDEYIAVCRDMGHNRDLEDW
ncbi:hypothetical protein J3459_022358 [Metarhizium acridum]|nr:hypothetical protein J3459_022358 [Metarhizium acridum]